MELLKSETLKNLARAYVGESCARNRYDMMAFLAKKDELTCLSKMIKEVATNEFHHARMLFSFIDSADTKHTIDNITVSAGYPFKQKIGTLEENLRLAVEDEQNEAHKIYPEFAQVAKKEGFNDIANLFLNLVQVETCHSKLFQILYDQMKNGTMYKLPNLVKWKCKDCGYEETLKEAWQKCPICMAPQGHVMLHINDGAK